MPRSFRLLLLLMCPLLAHCAPGAYGSGNAGIAGSSVEFRLQSLEAKYLELEQKQQALEALAAERLQTLVDQVAQLRARLGEPAQAQAAAQPPQPTPPARQAATPQPPKRPEPPKAAQPQTRTQEKPAPAPATPRATPAPSPPQPEPQTPAPAVTASGKALFQQALERIQAGEPARAVPLLEKYVAENPSGALTPEAYYWLGEARFFSGQFDEAILAYKNVAGRFPTHAKAPEAMLKIGYAYEKLQDPNNARFYLQALVDEYPASPSATLAKDKIAQLGI